MLALACLLPLGQVSAAEPDPIALQLYGIRLLQSGTRLRSYPEDAYRKKLTGTAMVVISIGKDGSLQSIELRRSSGHAALDEHALAILAKAVPITEIPMKLRNTAFTINVSMVFELSLDSEPVAILNFATPDIVGQ